MRVIRHTRFIKGSGAVASPATTRKTIELQLSSSARILSIISADTLDVEHVSVEAKKEGIVIIQNSSGGVNDGVNQVVSVTDLSDTVSRVKLKRSMLRQAPGQAGQILFAKHVVIIHDLGTKDLNLNVRDTVNGILYQLNHEIPDQNTLILKPDVPIEGSFRVTVSS
ncbi:MAG: hypothetical protein JXQ90_18355 [Cyclobacteriaceae bacterium]